MRRCGLAGVEVLAVDGTKVHANASERATRDYEQLAREILREADEIDAAEDEQFGDRRGDELPPELATAAGRRERLAAAEQRPAQRGRTPARFVRHVARAQGGQAAPGGGAVDRAPRQRCLRAHRARGVGNGRRVGRPPKPHTPPSEPVGTINVTDPDSRNLKTPRGYLQGYNAQEVGNEHQIVVGAEVSISSADVGQMVR